MSDTSFNKLLKKCETNLHSFSNCSLRVSPIQQFLFKTENRGPLPINSRDIRLSKKCQDKND